MSQDPFHPDQQSESAPSYVDLQTPAGATRAAPDVPRPAGAYAATDESLAVPEAAAESPGPDVEGLAGEFFDRVETARRVLAGEAAGDPRPTAGDFQHSTGGWEKTEDGWVQSPEALAGEFLAGVEGGPDLQGKDLNAHYAGEERQAAWRKSANPTDTTETTFYANEEQRQAMAAGVEGPQGQGLLTGADGALLDGSFGWVVDPDDGALYVFTENQALAFADPDDPDKMSIRAAREALASGRVPRIAYIHHSSVLAGAPVAGAGVMTVSKGRITSINDTSGHYRAEAEFLHQSLSELDRQGVDLSEADVTLGGARMDRRPGKAWLDQQDEFGKDQISLSWEQFEQTGGNEPQIRRKMSAQDELMADPRVRYLRGRAEDTAVEGLGTDEPESGWTSADAPAGRPGGRAGGLGGEDAADDSVYVGGVDDVTRPANAYDAVEDEVVIALDE